MKITILLLLLAVVASLHGQRGVTRAMAEEIAEEPLQVPHQVAVQLLGAPALVGLEERPQHRRGAFEGPREDARRLVGNDAAAAPRGDAQRREVDEEA